jgi:membrane-bound metal-dependent hydrolase YbcI (DUF457 family)
MALFEIISQNEVIKRNPTVKIDFNKLIGKTFLGTALGSFAGILPDLLEPADNPHHRKLFHSKSAGVLLVSSGLNLNNTKFSLDKKQLLACIFAGYLSRLYKDSQTDMGLPLFY